MKKLYLVVAIILMIVMVGCSNPNEKFGKVEGNNYINKVYGFSIEIPTNFEVVEDVKKLNGSGEIAEDIEELIIFSGKEATDGQAQKALTILVLNKSQSASQYAKDFYEGKSEDKSINAKIMLNKYINGQEFVMLEYENGAIYYTDYEDKIIEFNFANSSEEEIESVIHSISFEE